MPYISIYTVCIRLPSAIPSHWIIFHQRHFLPLQLTQQGLRLGDSAADGLASGAATAASLRGGAASSRLTCGLAREAAALRFDHPGRHPKPR